MHEYSIVSDLIILCEQNAREHNAKKIFEISIEVGERSGVEIELLKIAFDIFKEESEFCKDAILKIIYKRIRLRCNSCNSIFDAKGLEYGICKFCNSAELDIIKGKELNLLRLEME
ncbi:hydrogenase maturation nickel metallochaperone HypA [Helicobacter sp. MIT 14-3879]|nr:hydrogenase maturation nickel metallochaperone HypA [Helicobacter sp. MIT 14-3879]